MALIAGLKLLKLPWTPAAPTLTRDVMAAARSRTKTSKVPLVSPPGPSRSVADDANATTFPFPLKTIALSTGPVDWPPATVRFSRVVVFVWRSRTKAST